MKFKAGSVIGLLVVLAVILLIIGILMPSLGAARRTARHVSDQSISFAEAPLGYVARGMAGQDMRALDATVGQAPDRMIARSAVIWGEVDDVQAAATRIANEAASIGGMVQSAEIRPAEGDAGTARLVLRVPADRLDASLDQVKGMLGKIGGLTVNAEDVTDQAVDLEARLKNLTAAEVELREILTTARQGSDGIKDVLAAQREITRVREQIERLTAQRDQLARRVIYATVVITLNTTPRPDVQVAGPVWGVVDTLGFAVSLLGATARWFANVLVFAVVFGLPVSLVLAGPAYLIRRYALRDNRVAPTA
ncbi:MAG: DUF4349 domain-containing protein [Planctomycetota bacterium]